MNGRPADEPARLDLNGVKHIAVIMDGNGRWATGRGLPRTLGHREGIKSVREITTACAKAGLQQLTLYALSAENFTKRPPTELTYLMSLLRRYLVQERRTIMENDIRFRTIGRIDELSTGVRNEIARTAQLSAGNSGMVLCLALNYGGRLEILDAAKKLAEDVKAGLVDPASLDESAFRNYLYDPGMTDPDLLIRTGGEMRVSNFLLWQVSYSEIHVTSTCWPDFRTKDLEEGIRSYVTRKRKFGGLLTRVDV